MANPRYVLASSQNNVEHSFPQECLPGTPPPLLSDDESSDNELSEQVTQNNNNKATIRPWATFHAKNTEQTSKDNSQVNDKEPANVSTNRR